MLRMAILTLHAVLLTAATAEDRDRFFRVVGESDMEITGFNDGGFLEMTGTNLTESYVIERSDPSGTTPWITHARSDTSNYVTRVRVMDTDPPSNTVFIPGGRFNMGDALGDFNPSRPVHEVHVDPFYMQAVEVTNEEMRQVYQWAHDQGYVTVVDVPLTGAFGGRAVQNTTGITTNLYMLDEYAEEMDFENGTFEVKAGKENHPSIYVTWYGSVAYCHFRSLMENKETCYSLSDWSCDFTKEGYRLPTEAEWEYAARGGFEGMRFPWGDTNVITHSRANYRSGTNIVYDVSPTIGFHPDYASQPLRTSPVGMFPPNAYGLYDMCGNVWDWVWDWADRYSSGSLTNPVGPATGINKIFRGGSNFTVAWKTTCAVRFVASAPEDFAFDVGFRYALRAMP